MTVRKFHLGLTEHSSPLFGLDVALAALVADGRLSVVNEGAASRADAINAMAKDIAPAPAAASGAVTVTLNKVELDAEERRSRAIRAKEVLDGASWLFDEFISEAAREMIASPAFASNERERLYADIRAAMGLKAHLISILQNHEAENTLNERRSRNNNDESDGA